MTSIFLREIEWLEICLIHMITKHIKISLTGKVSYSMDTPVYGITGIFSSPGITQNQNSIFIKEKNRTNVMFVIMQQLGAEICGHIKESILERNRINVIYATKDFQQNQN